MALAIPRVCSVTGERVPSSTKQERVLAVQKFSGCRCLFMGSRYMRFIFREIWEPSLVERLRRDILIWLYFFASECVWYFARPLASNHSHVWGEEPQPQTPRDAKEIWRVKLPRSPRTYPQQPPTSLLQPSPPCPIKVSTYRDPIISFGPVNYSPTHDSLRALYDSHVGHRPWQHRAGAVHWR